MIFETVEEEFHRALDAIYPMSKISNQRSLSDRLLIASLGDNEILLSIMANHEVAAQAVFKARVEQAGALEIRFPLIHELIEPTRGQAGTYRFVSDSEMGVVKIKFDIGAFSITSYHVSDYHNSPTVIKTSNKEEVARFQQEDFIDAWEHVRRAIKGDIDELYPLKGYVAFRSGEDSLFLQVTDGQGVLSQCPLPSSFHKKDSLHLVPAPVLEAASHMVREGEEICLHASEEPREYEMPPFSETLGNFVLTSEKTGLKLGTQTSVLKFYDFAKALEVDRSDSILMLIPRDDFQDAVNAALSMSKDTMEPVCYLELNPLGHGKSCIEKTYPQLADQDLAGVLTVGTEHSSYDLLVPTAKNFQSCKRYLNSEELSYVIEGLNTDALLLQLQGDAKSGKPLVIGCPGVTNEKISAISFVHSGSDTT